MSFVDSVTRIKMLSKRIEAATIGVYMLFYLIKNFNIMQKKSSV